MLDSLDCPLYNPGSQLRRPAAHPWLKKTKSVSLNGEREKLQCSGVWAARHLPSTAVTARHQWLLLATISAGWSSSVTANSPSHHLLLPCYTVVLSSHKPATTPSATLCLRLQYLQLTIKLCDPLSDLESLLIEFASAYRSYGLQMRSSEASSKIHSASVVLDSRRWNVQLPWPMNLGNVGCSPSLLESPLPQPSNAFCRLLLLTFFRFCLEFSFIEPLLLLYSTALATPLWVG